MGAAKRTLERRRAHRYRLLATDGSSLRFQSQRWGRVYSADILDVSETGLAFLVPRKWAPKPGKNISMEFSFRGGMRIACIARVVRVAEYRAAKNGNTDEDLVRIGVMYHTIHRRFTRVISDLVHQARLAQARPMVRMIRGLRPRGESVWMTLFQSVFILSFVTVLIAGVFFFFQTFEIKARPSQGTWAEKFFDKALQKK